MEKQEVKRLVVNNVDFKLLFEKYNKLWTLSKARNISGEIDVDNSWEELNRRIYYAEQFVPRLEKNREEKIHKFVYVFLRVAAVLFIVFGLIYYLSYRSPQITTKHFTSISAKKVPFVLPDKSKVYLNSQSDLIYPVKFVNNQRNVDFKGEALFEVSHNPAKPFIVNAGDVRIKVLGTVFDLRNFPDENEITVYLKSGKILFYSIDKNDNTKEQIVLLPGQKGIYNKTTGLISRSIFNNENFLSWKTGNLEFTKTPLPDVFRTLENTYNISIVSEIPCDTLYLTARFTNEKPQTVFEALHMIFGFNYKISGNTARIY